MMFPKYARYDKVINSVNYFYEKESINDFPLDPFKVIERNRWGLMTYSELAEIHGLTLEQVINAFQSVDGYTIYTGENYTIAYNDKIKSKRRIRFTLMHEIGHIYMNHLADFEETVLRRSTLTDEKYKVLEDESNAFARNALAPAEIINNLNLRTIEDLVFYFDISGKAAKTRLEFLTKDLIKWITFSSSRLMRFKSFMHTVTYSNYCNQCKHYFVRKKAYYCPICGNEKLSKKGRDKMIYNGFKTNKEGFPDTCPRCSNQQLGGGAFCKICGIQVLNKCTNKEYDFNEVVWECGTIAEGNARFCVVCGTETTYYRDGLLKPWDQDQNEEVLIVRRQVAVTDDPFAPSNQNIDISDDDLPF